MGESGEKNKRVLSGDDRRVLPVKTQTCSLQPDDAEIHSIADRGEASGEIELNVSRGFGSGHSRTENLKANFRLTQRRSDGSQWSASGHWFSIVGKVQIVRAAHVSKRIHQHNPVQSCSILRCSFDLGLILLVNFGPK